MNLYKKGECYKNAYQYAAAHSSEGWRIVHAVVSGQGPIEGVRFGHAWVERRNHFGLIEAHDPALDLTIPAEVYRDIGKASNVKVYTLDQARIEMVKHKHYGPWDEEIGSAVHVGKKRKKNPLISGDKDYEYVKDENNWMYHYGDTGTGRDTKQWRMSRQRGTGHFGTGTYFVSEKRRQSPEARFYGSRPEYRVNVTGLRLVTFQNSNEVDKFHKVMKEFTNIVGRIQDGEPWLVQKTWSRDKELPPGKRLAALYREDYGRPFFNLMEKHGVHELDIPTRMGRPQFSVLDESEPVMEGVQEDLKHLMFYMHMILRFGQLSDSRCYLSEDELMRIAKPIIEKHARFRRLGFSTWGYDRVRRKKADMITAGTEFLMALGYDGIDARNTTSDDFDRGSVLFPGWRNKVPPEAIQMLRGASSL